MSSLVHIYWDYNSTTPCSPEVVAEMLPLFTDNYGNAASIHPLGRAASSVVEKAREEVAHAIGAVSNDVVFTSGATESNNLVLLGFAKNSNERRKIIVSAVEHKSVLGPAWQLLEDGYELEVLPVDHNGVVDLEVAAKVIDKNTLVVSVQGANNETGVLQPIREIAQLARDQGAFCHCDAAQMLGKVPINVEDLGVDAASFSAHKVYGPKGIGALYIRGKRVRSEIKPICYGGGQENEMRPGTLNVPAIAGFACACRVIGRVLDAESKLIAQHRDFCEKYLLGSIEGACINGSGTLRLPGTISLTVPGIPADMLAANLPSVCVSVGSACNSGAPDSSHVLLAMKIDRSAAESTLRISLGRYTTQEEIEHGCREIITAAKELRTKLDYK